MPSIISGKKIGFLEPQEKIWAGESGRSFNLCDISRDHLVPLDGISGFARDTTYYPKTLLRFPLRKTASGLSKNVYTVQKVNELIDALKSEAKLLLLFLRSVHTIQVYNIDSLGNAVLSFETKIAKASADDLAQKRDSFNGELKSCHKTHGYDFSHVISFTCKFDVYVYSATTDQTTTSQWLVSSRVDSSNAKVRAASVQQKVFPWVGTAVEINNPGDGRIFCVLPMPKETASNLPVHVNGAFSINDDRRSLKWPAVDRKNDLSADWNQMLVRDVIPLCYIDLLLEVKSYLKEGFYKAWPNVERVRHTQWEALLNPVFNTLWVNSVILCDSGIWVTPGSAVYMPKLRKPVADVVKMSLTNCSVNIAEVSACVWEAFAYTGMQATEINQYFVCEKLQAVPNSYANFSPSQKLELLKYCLSDWKYDNNQFANLELLPLANGSFTAFHSYSQNAANAVYLSTKECPKKLLPNMDHKIVDLCGNELHSMLTHLTNSKTTRLRILDVSAVSKLLDEAMPSSWRNVNIVPLPSDKFTLEWFKIFWEWLEKKNLPVFRNKYLFPVNCGNMPVTTRFSAMRLLESQSVLYIPSYTECSGAMLSVLSKFGILYCSQASFPFVKHRHLNKFFQKFSIGALLELIMNKQSFSSVTLSVEEAQYLQKELSEVQLSPNNRSVLLNLQIFSTCSNTSNRLYSVNTAQKSHGKTLREPQSHSMDMSVLPENMIVFSSQNYYQNLLLDKLDIAGINNIAGFLTDHVFPNLHSMDDSYIDGIMTNILDMCPSMSGEFTAEIKNLQFVKVASGVRKRPTELFDPNNKFISNILRGEHVFPSAPYNAPNYIKVLKLCCGLNTSVPAQKVLDTIFSISLKYSCSPLPVDEVKMQQSKDILEYIASRDFKCDGTFKINPKIEKGYIPFATALTLLSDRSSWLPVLAKRPRNYPACLPWKGEGYTSHFISLSSSSCVSSSSLPLLPLTYGSQVFFTNPCKHLEPDQDQLSESLVPHLLKVIDSKEGILREQMTAIVDKVYSAMMATDMNVLKKLMRTKKWVYIRKHHKFVSIDNIAFGPNSTFDHFTEPYLYILPDSISAFSELFVRFGMNESITRSQIVSMLGTIKEEVSTRPSSESVSSGTAWNMVMAILNWLTENGTKVVDSENVYVPVESSSELPDLRKPDGLVYADGEYIMSLVSSSEGGSQHTFVHKRVTQQLAKCLNITSLTQQLDISEGTFKDAGQRESLIVRLKTILREYKDGLTIVKELIQNADDAEATEVNICYDARTHTTDRSKLVFPDMSEAHGPALVVHNDAVFSDEDFENIQKLAAATKENKHLKIGKFGVGFCSVYHITDVPSFLSWERLCIFDPTLKHLDKAVKNKSKPGKMVKYRHKLIAGSRQMKPYDGLFGFRCDEEYNGTMFRLPFRKSSSELSTTCYSDATAQDLIESIQHCGDKLLLFLQHVKRITVQRFDEGKSSPDVVFELRKTYIPHECLSLESTSVVAVSSTSGSSAVSRNWLVATHETVSEGKTAVADVACSLNGSCEPYSVNGNLSGEVFCYLPLSLSSGLPVHVNCNFAVASNRRGIQTAGTTTSDSSKLVEWNISLMKNVLPEAYVRLLCSLSKMLEMSTLKDYKFYSLWPSSSSLQQKNPWENLIGPFFNLVQTLTLFYSESTSKWLRFQDCKFLKVGIFGHSSVLSSVLDILHQLRIPLVDLPSAHRTHLQSIQLIEEKDFIELFFANLSELKEVQLSRNEVVYQLLKTFTSEKETNLAICQLIKSRLENYACIPTTPDGSVLRKCTEMIDPGTSFAKLFEESDHRFPIPRLTDDLAISALKHTGMMYTSLPWELIIDRAQSIHAVMKTDPLKALHRVQLTLFTMCTTMSASGEPPYCEPAIDSVPFLPVMKKPEDYPLNWYGEDYQLLPGNQLVLSGSFTENTKNLRIAGSTVAYLSEDPPRNGGCGIIYEPKVRNLLHLREQPSLDEVVAHLQAVISWYNSSSDSPDIDHSWISQSCKEIYNYFESLLEFEGPELDLSELKKIPCIWNENLFLEIESVAMKWKLENGPCLYVTPPYVAANKKLSKALCIKDRFVCKDAIRALKMMKTMFGEKSVDDSCKELFAELIRIFDKQEEVEDNSDMYLLDSQDILRNASDLQYNNAPWLPVDTDSPLVSGKLPRELATKLGVQLVRSVVLDQYASEKPPCFGVSFGQHEELTQRIQNIIREYPPNITILKELLQNADDAKAKKMCIILDTRTHGKESVISEKWKELQGPALLVWNDRTFSEVDLEGIQKLGLGSKRSDSETIGQFGIGFNVVYHLTDCPSFITGGDTLCVLDPHCRYVPEAEGDKALPGARYDKLKDRFWSRFTDMASAYLQTGTNDIPGELLGGSLFRFPLRQTHEMEKESKIFYSKEGHGQLRSCDLLRKMKDWMPQMKQAMFFLNHVTEMKFMVINDKGSLETLYHFKADIQRSEGIDQSLEALHSATSNFTPMSECKPSVACYPLNISEVNPEGNEKLNKSETWLIQRGIGDLNDENCSWQYIEVAKPKHGIAAPLETPKNVAQQDKMKIFCFLPLPNSKSWVPVHINGSFILDANRKRLWQSTDPDALDDKARWNSHILKAIASSYANFICQAKDYYLKPRYSDLEELSVDVEKYYSLFPSFPSEDAAKSTLQCMVYRHLVQSNASVMCTLVHKKDGDGVDVEWHPLTSETESDQVHFWSHTPLKVREVIHPIFQNIGLIVTSAPIKVMKCLNSIINVFKTASGSSQPNTSDEAVHKEWKIIPCICEDSVFQYYTKHSIFASERMEPSPVADTAFGDPERFLIFVKFLVGNLESTSTNQRNVSSIEISEFPGDPFSHFLLLTADEELKAFDKVFNSEFYDLFPNHLDKFIHPIMREIHFSAGHFISGSANEEEHKRVLAMILEMFDDTLPLELKDEHVISNATDVIDAQTLSSLWKCFGEDLVFQSFLSDVLKHWALLLTTDNRLFSTSSDILPSYSPTGTEHDLMEVYMIMKKLKLPFLDTDVVTASVMVCPTLSDRVSTLSNFYHINMDTLLTVVLTKDNIDTLIKYFSSEIFPDKPEWVEKITSLPLFEDISGDYKPISGCDVYIWPLFACSNGYSQWNSENRAVFLKKQAEWKYLGLPDKLKVGSISIEQIYTRFIFKNFHTMDEATRYEHLKYIKDNLYEQNSAVSEFSRNKYNSDKVDNAQHFVQKLKALKCIGLHSSELKSVSHISDHTKKIFQVFSSEFCILPEQIRSKEWLKFFRSLGLKVMLTEAEYLQLCEGVSSGNFEPLKDYSAALLDYIFSYEVIQLWRGNKSFLEKVSEIPFAVTTDTSAVDWIVPSCYPKMSLVKLNGTASHKLLTRIWTVKPVVELPIVCTFMPPGEELKCLLQCLNITIDTSVDDVVSNMTNICNGSPLTDETLFNNYPQNLIPQNNGVHDLCAVVSDNLKFLEPHCDEEAVMQLSRLACIPVHCDLLDVENKKVVLVKPDCVVGYLSEDEKQFHPFLHSIPSKLNRTHAHRVLMTIGVQDKLVLHHMQVLLKKIYSQSNGGELDPNSKKCVKKALQQLGEFLRREIESPFESLSPLYLPNTSDELKLSTTLLYNDTPSYMGQVKIDLRDTKYSHFNISESGYGIDAQTLCQMLPDEVSPLGMSTVCRQVPDEGCEVIEASALSKSIEKFVKDSDPVAIAKVFKKLAHYDNQELVEKEISDFLSHLKFVTMKNLRTRVVLKDAETKLIGKVTTEFYLDHKVGSETVVYADHRLEDEHYMVREISESIYQAINTIAGGTMNSISWRTKTEVLNVLESYLKASSMSKKLCLLSRFHVDAEVNVKLSGFSVEIGVEIPECYHHRLDENPHNIFHPMELVGYEDKEDHLIVAQVVYLVKREEISAPRDYLVYTSKSDTEGKEVSIFDLYKFSLSSPMSTVPSLVGDETASLVPFSSRDDEATQRRFLYLGDLKMKKHICDQLLEYQKLDPDLRAKAFRRLYLRWHPDKHLENQTKATEIFTFLKKQIENLENNGCLVKYSRDEDSPTTGDESDEDGMSPTPDRITNSASHQNLNDSITDNFHRWGLTVKCRHGASNLENTEHSNAAVTSALSHFDEQLVESEKKNPEEGNRWVKQAENDFTALEAFHSIASSCSGYNFVCFLAHQVAEKAMKGAVYALCGVDRREVADHSLKRLVRILADKAAELAEKAIPLENYDEKTRYPDMWPDCIDTPSDKYNKEDAELAKEHAQAVLRIVKGIMPQDDESEQL